MEALTVADTIVLQAVVALAITAPTHSCIQYTDLLETCQLCWLPLIVLAIQALAKLGVAGNAPLQADTVELSALATLAVASSWGVLLQLELHHLRIGWTRRALCYWVDLRVVAHGCELHEDFGIRKNLSLLAAIWNYWRHRVLPPIDFNRFVLSLLCACRLDYGHLQAPLLYRLELRDLLLLEGFVSGLLLATGRLPCIKFD